FKPSGMRYIPFVYALVEILSFITRQIRRGERYHAAFSRYILDRTETFPTDNRNSHTYEQMPPCLPAAHLFRRPLRISKVVQPSLTGGHIRSFQLLQPLTGYILRHRSCVEGE